MDLEIIKEEKDWVEIEVDVDQSLLGWLVDKLNKDKNVVFAACKKEHPQVGKPKLILRTKGKDAKKLLISTIEESEKEVEKFSKAFERIVKKK